MKKIFVIFFAAVVCFVIPCAGRVYKYYEPGDPRNRLIDKIDSIIIGKMTEYNLPGLAVGVIKGDSIIYSKGYGIKSINHEGNITKSSNFHTASISKIFTALATMKLVGLEKLTLDDKLVDVVPELRYKDSRVEKVTIKQLLNHTSGIPDLAGYNWKQNNQTDASRKEFIKKLHLKLKFDPSTKFLYSNLAYDILGYAIEKRSGMLFEDFVKQNVLLPGGMMNSDFRYFVIPDSLNVSPHSKDFLTKTIRENKTYPYTIEHAPSSTLNSSALELSSWMITFLRELDNDRSGLYQLMISKSTNVNSHIGLGFQLYSLFDENAIGHFGGDKGFRSYLVMIPEKKIGVVVLGNCDFNEDFRQEIAHPILKLMVATE